jgi:hypothetical protein
VSETQVLKAEAFSRFRQTVRMNIRQHVRREGVAPPLTLWASRGDNPRRIEGVRVGVARTEAELRSNVVGAIHRHESHFAALGRLLYMMDKGDGSRFPTHMYGLICACADRVEAWDVAIVNGKVEAWSPAKIGDGREGPDNAWFWITQAVRGASRGDGSVG